MVGITSETLASLGLSQADIRRHLGITDAAVSRKVRGHRAWKISELTKVLDLVRETHPDATLEDLLADPGEQQAAQAPELAEAEASTHA